MTWIRPSLRVVTLVLGALLVLTPGTRAQVLTLDEALDAAFATHPGLASAEARVLAAEGAGQAARATRLPAVVLSTSLLRFQEPMVVAPFHGLDFANPPTFDRTLVQGQLGAQYTLFDGGMRASRIRGADAAQESTRAARAGTEISLVEQVVVAYVGSMTARSLLEAAEAQVAVLDAEHARAQRRFDAGSAPRVEVLRAEAVRQEARAAEATASARAELAERVLARIMGAEAARVAGRPLSALSPRGASADFAAAPSPSVVQADRALAVAEARLAEERAARLPSVQIGAGLQDFGTVDGGHALEWRTGVELSWPMFNGGARSASVRRAAAEVDAARAELQATRMHVDDEIDQAATAVFEADARLEALAAAVTQWEEVARIEALALEAGSGEQLDLLRAQAGVLEARAGQAVARRDAILARVRVAAARGVLSRDWIAASMETR